MARTQQERRADTRRRLLQAAADLFARHGIDAVSVDAVADTAERTSGAIYDHFGSKQGLVLAVLDDLQQSLVDTVLADFDTAADLHGRLRAVAAQLVVQPSEETRRLLLLEQELALRAARDPEVAAVARRRDRQVQHWLTRGFAAWVDQGLLHDAAPPAVLAATFRAAVAGLSAQHRLDPDQLHVEDVAACLALAIGVRLSPTA